ncbi:MAG: transcription termination factor Rho [Clostridia bacterium]|nr:transcription termination factor Rho [Clostridia bacterium]
MSGADFAGMTVIELRKYAKEHGIVLSAGMNKADIVTRLTSAAEGQVTMEEPAEEAAPAKTPEPVEAEKPAEPAKPTEPAKPAFRAAWHNPSNRYTNQRASSGFGPARGFGPAQPERPAQPAAPAFAAPQETPAPRAGGYSPRFGPAARTEDRAPAEPSDEPRQPIWYTPEPGTQQDTPVPSFSAPAPAQPAAPAYRASAPQPRPYEQPAAQRPYAPAAQPAPSPAQAASLTVAEELSDGSGVLELHPEGYGFLRVNNLLASASDIYVAPSQLKRYGLREGDLVEGKIRPLREGDKYAALLTVTSVNGGAPEKAPGRLEFDRLTAVYPTRRFEIDRAESARRTARFLDLAAPIGFGQRALLLCPPDSGKTGILRDLANAITEAHPEAVVTIVLLDENPEDVTMLRDQVRCEVLATTFDQSPENPLRLSELVLERAERNAETGGHSVLLVDSLTRLSKAYTMVAAQQGRATPGTVNAASLYRARRLFGAARALREGGSLTVIGCMNIATGNKQDDTIIDEFREAANCVITLDATLARAGLKPAVSWHQSGTRRCGLFLSDSRKEGMRVMRPVLDAMSDAAAHRQVTDLMNLAPDNDDLLGRMPELVSLMQGKK